MRPHRDATLIDKKSLCHEASEAVHTQGMRRMPYDALETKHSDYPTAIRKAAGGFTLLEILIAITITAMLGTGAFYLLSQGIRTKDSTEARGEILEELQKSQRIIEYDFSQAVPRSIRGEYGDQFYAFSNLNALTLVEFTRTGWRDPKSLLALMDEDAEVVPRSQLQRVSYEMEEDDLYRVFWDVLDRAQDSKPYRQMVMEDVEEIRLRFLDNDNEWAEQWPPQEQLVNSESDPYHSLPKAVELEFTHKTFGKVRRLYQISGSSIPAAEAADENGSDKKDPDDNGGGDPPDTKRK
ncbi:type II secretion system minor pseudopilin GspJ [Hahella ganghwensis]|uniref:type II secretion system minor pseudopilin GspJ n=1 Tax=Hahella ganghwensis TaxID=286420 RepID=UPI00037CF972|nr:type II secretion system minor pseudopilin GspJ [Hahella ganghwensis]